MIKPTGFNLPLSYQQVLSWVLFLYWLICYTLLIPLYNLEAKISLSFSILILALTIIYLNIKISKSDPTDPFVDKFKRTVAQNLPFLEEFSNFCALCGTPVQDQSKHCMVCYRCVDKFDHHCTWVNNCIGQQNYSTFFKLILIFECFLLLVFAMSVHNLNFYWKNQEKYNEMSEFGKKNIKNFMPAVVVCCITSGLATVFNGYLIAFHLWLWKVGMTTFQFLIRPKKNRIEAEESESVKNDVERDRLNRSKVSNTNEGKYKQPDGQNLSEAV